MYNIPQDVYSQRFLAKELGIDISTILKVLHSQKTKLRIIIYLFHEIYLETIEEMMELIGLGQSSQLYSLAICIEVMS